MKKFFYILELFGALMLACGLAFPFFLGTRITPTMYNILQMGGIALAILGWIGKSVIKK